jgi:hypothetical protein
MEGEIFTDFDPLSPEGQEDVNETIDTEYDSLIPNDGESGESYISRFKQKFGSKYKYAIDRFNEVFRKRNQGKDLPVYMELKNISSKEHLEELEKNKSEAASQINKLFPEWDPSKSNFLFTIDEYDRVEIKQMKGKKVYYLSNNENWVSKLPQSLKNNLGRSVYEIQEYNDAKSLLDSLYQDNKITNENNFDLRYNNDVIEVTHDNLSKWYKLFNKDKTLSRNLPKIITDNIGESSILKSDKITEKINDNRAKQQHIEAQVIVTNKKINDETSSISSIQSSIEDQQKLINDVNEQSDYAPSMEQQEKIMKYEREKQALKTRLNDLNQKIETEKQGVTSLETQNENLQSEIEELENERETIEERLPLRERVKQIIKRYGLTVTGIALSVGVIIGVIVNSLKSGLSSVAKGVGNGLKTIGKKLGQILPGMVGAIASFIFRTAGEVVGFLAKNVWLLIIAVVMYMVERYKNKR